MNGTTNTMRKPKFVKKVEYKWSDNEILKLISAVKKHPALWQANESELYKLPKKSLWEKVSEDVGIELIECKAKWSNLRISFKTNYNKFRTKKSEEGVEDVNTIHWRFFKHMLFVKSYDSKNLSESTLNLEVEDSNAENTVSDTQSFTKTAVQHERRLLPATSSRNVHKMIKTLAAEKSLQPTDEFSIFGEYIGSELRLLPLNRAQRLKTLIWKKILDEASTNSSTFQLDSLDKSCVEPSTHQYQLIVEKLRKVPFTANGFHDNNRSCIKEFWTTVGQELNEMGPAQMDDESWRAVWEDYKDNITEKLNANEYCKRNDMHPISELELNAVNISGIAMVKTTVPEENHFVKKEFDADSSDQDEDCYMESDNDSTVVDNSVQNDHEIPNKRTKYNESGHSENSTPTKPDRAPIDHAADSNYYFLMSLLRFMDDFDPIENMEVRAKIQNSVMEATIKKKAQ